MSPRQTRTGKQAGLFSNILDFAERWANIIAPISDSDKIVQARQAGARLAGGIAVVECRPANMIGDDSRIIPADLAAKGQQVTTYYEQLDQSLEPSPAEEISFKSVIENR